MWPHLPRTWAELESLVGRAVLPAAGQFALCHCRVGGGLFVHQFHAVAGIGAGGHRRIGPAARHAAHRLRRQDGRDAAEERAGPDVRPAKPAGDELGGPQHLRQHGRPRAGRSGQQAGKIASKDHLLGEILGYQPQTLVSIEYIESLGDWKTAWDHIHFAGFLGTPMTMQFTWQGCDSVLAAPLVLDLMRFTELARRRGETGLLRFLASFFKSPLGVGRAPFRPAVPDVGGVGRRAGRAKAQGDRQDGSRKPRRAGEERMKKPTELRSLRG